MAHTNTKLCCQSSWFWWKWNFCRNLNEGFQEWKISWNVSFIVLDVYQDLFGPTISLHGTLQKVKVRNWIGTQQHQKKEKECRKKIDKSRKEYREKKRRSLPWVFTSCSPSFPSLSFSWRWAVAISFSWVSAMPTKWINWSDSRTNASLPWFSAR